jgi:hypothetical protein
VTNRSLSLRERAEVRVANAENSSDRLCFDTDTLTLTLSQRERGLAAADSKRHST